MNIRKMLITDYEGVYNLWMSCKGMGLNNLDDSKEGIEKFLRRNPNTCFVCEKDNNVIGVIMSGHDGRRGYIYHTAVHPDYRLQGIGSSLVKNALNSLKEDGINKVALIVFKRNEVGNGFWEHIGFTSRDDIIYRNKAISELIRFDS